MTTERTCKAHGTYQAEELVVLFADMPPIVSPCPRCALDQEAEQERQRNAEAQRLHRARFKAVVAAAQIPVRYADASLDAYVVTSRGQATVRTVCAAFISTWADQLRTGVSLVLTGAPGTGKTHLACAIANAVMAEHASSVLFGTAADLMLRIRDTYRKDSQASESQARAALIAPDLLIIDEVGAHRGTEYELQLLFEIINARYQQCKPMIVISNLDGEQLEAFLGQRVMDRFRECGSVLAFDWSSYRRAGAQPAQGQRQGAANG
jgi:DNA replication protein DnaC